MQDSKGAGGEGAPMGSKPWTQIRTEVLGFNELCCRQLGELGQAA